MLVGNKAKFLQHIFHCNLAGIVDMLSEVLYEEHLESKEHFAIKKYLLIIGKKKELQVLSHTFTYFST